MRYDAIIFDLFGTLVDNLPAAAFKQTLTQIATILRVPAPELISLWRGELWQRRVRGEFASLPETYNYVCNTFGVTVSESQIEEAVKVRFDYSRRSLAPRVDTVETLRTLKAAGYAIGLISDCSMEIPQLWDKSALAPLIDVPLFSCAVKLKKPDPHIYALAHERLDIPAERCLYVGDGGSRELTGATATGMQAVLIYAPYETFKGHSEHQEEVDGWQGPKISAIREILTIVDETLLS
ncbi:haloacid dehalogenase [Dictyobacter alpinus]|uniref:Haloacid dehalogenase n=2 Tax=Dictyobacter alpinus TaxID=2014873 RepID=A0A402AZV3_9CHLR|nr:haloacid dehalogenase [Dictyobacter alpinus]